MIGLLVVLGIIFFFLAVAKKQPLKFRSGFTATVKSPFTLKFTRKNNQLLEFKRYMTVGLPIRP